MQGPAEHVWGYRCICKEEINYCLITGLGRIRAERGKWELKLDGEDTCFVDRA